MSNAIFAQKSQYLPRFGSFCYHNRSFMPDKFKFCQYTLSWKEMFDAQWEISSFNFLSFIHVNIIWKLIIVISAN